jgi:dissimilatory sulfite reductase related protein
MEAITVKGKTLKLDEHGFLDNPDEWNTDVATYIAAVEGIQMTEPHWEVVNFLREYYTQYKIAPKVKILVNEIGNKPNSGKVNAKYLYKLYPCGPAKQACKIAGLPQSSGCV